MNLALYIARRYLFAKKSHNAINIISLISVCGVVVASAAMVCTLSVFNGFKGLQVTFFSAFDPDLKITAVESKVFDPTTPEMESICHFPEVELFSCVLQENAIVQYGDRQEIAVLKGVDSSYHKLVKVEKAIIDGKFQLGEDDFYYGVLGIALSYKLGVNASFVHPMEIFMPDRTSSVNMAVPSASIRNEYAYIGGVYHIGQPVYDERFMFVSIELMRSMLDYEKEISALEIKLVPEANVASVKKKISLITGEGFEVKDRYEQQDAAFKIVQIEKRVSYLMLCLLLVLALFSVIGSLAILIIEKKDDVVLLRSMGADSHLINKIFLFEGWMISICGAIIGIIAGIILCLLQQHFGIIKFGDTAGVFIIDAYPVELEWADILIIFITVVTIGFMAVFYSVKFLGKKWLAKSAVLLLLATLMISCSGQKSADTERSIAVTIEPVRYFAEKIAGDKFDFFSVVPAGQGPETYDPSPREMVKVGKSIAYFHLGQLALEQTLVKSIKENNAGTEIFDLSKGMIFDPEELAHRHDHSHSHDDHSHGDTHDHTAHDHGDIHTHGGDSNSHGHFHGENDPHIWSSITGARVISENIYNALSSLDEENGDYYKSNYVKLIQELEMLDLIMHDYLGSLSCRGFVIYHPALTYFAAEFGLKQYSIEEDGKEPAPSSLKNLIKEAKEAHVNVVFVQAEFDQKHAEQIAAEIGAKVVIINPLDYKWDEQMKRIVEALMTDGKTD